MLTQNTYLNIQSEWLRNNSNYTVQRLKQDTEILLSELNERAGLVGMLPVIMANCFTQSFDN